MVNNDSRQIQEVLEKVKALAVEFYRLTGKPLGVTGEIGEYSAAKELGLSLAPARTAGYDAIRKLDNGNDELIQIKSRAYSLNAKPSQRIGTIKHGANCDIVLLVILDNQTLEPIEMWEAPYKSVVKRLKVPGSKARERGSMRVSEFKKLAIQVWPDKIYAGQSL